MSRLAFGPPGTACTWARHRCRYGGVAGAGADHEKGPLRTLSKFNTPACGGLLLQAVLRRRVMYTAAPRPASISALVDGSGTGVAVTAKSPVYEACVGELTPLTISL